MKAPRTWIVISLTLLAASGIAFATSVTGGDWNVYFSLPDQNALESPGEYDIRNALLARLDALQSNDQSVLADYSFSSNATANKILASISNALDRFAVVRFIADYGINTNDVYNGASLAALARRVTNPLILVRATNSSGIMHDKIGLFSYGGTNRWVFMGSWNFTSAASYQQWNIMLEARNDAMYAAYSNEMSQLLAGHFHYDPTKSHAWDNSPFRLADAWTNGWVRFAPYPDGRTSGDNAQTDITNLIGRAESEIVFGLNTSTRSLIRDALIAAADRGVAINGAMPKSDTDPAGNSSAIYEYLTNTTHYATTNIVHFITAFSKADGSAYDTGEFDLIHEKWMVIDPWSDNPWLIHGSANWSDAALVSTNSNDENIVFVPHRNIARIFYAQFKRMTGVWTNREDFWCDIIQTNGSLQAGLWMTDTNRFIFQHADSPLGAWTSTGSAITGFVGRLSSLTNGVDPQGFYRAVRQ